MKIDGTVTVYYSQDSCGEYVFVPEQKVDIPIGARVTVEWDENLHRCEEMKQTRTGSDNLALRRDDDGRWRIAGIELYVWNIRYCPYCGMRLGA